MQRRQALYRERPSFVVPLRSEFRLRAEKMVMKHDKLGIGYRVKEQATFRVSPYHEQELEWLRAFLSSVALLQKLEMPGKML